MKVKELFDKFLPHIEVWQSAALAIMLGYALLTTSFVEGLLSDTYTHASAIQKVVSVVGLWLVVLVALFLPFKIFFKEELGRKENGLISGFIMFTLMFVSAAVAFVFSDIFSFFFSIYIFIVLILDRISEGFTGHSLLYAEETSFKRSKFGILIMLVLFALLEAFAKSNLALNILVAYSLTPILLSGVK